MNNLFNRECLREVASTSGFELGDTSEIDLKEIREIKKTSFYNIGDFLSMTPIEEQRAIKICETYFFDRFVIIDTNVFMDDESCFLDMFRAYCHATERKLLMFGAQYFEILNVREKNKYRRNVKEIEVYGKAVKALKTIEAMQEEDSLNFLAMNKKAKAYADEYWLEKMWKMPDKKYTLITKDRDLRIQARDSFRYVDALIVNTDKCDYRLEQD